MVCPHCRVTIHAQPNDIPIGDDRDETWLLRRILCPACKRFILLLVNGPGLYAVGEGQCDNF